MSFFRSKGAICLTFLLASSSSWAHAQSTFANLGGIVSDPSGAQISDARVTIHEVRTGQSTTVPSRGDGRFEFLNLPPGRYRVEVTDVGFRRFSSEEFDLVARQVQRIDVVLGLATTAVELNVSAAPPIINSLDGSVSDATANRELINSPINYRTFNTSPFQAVYVLPEVLRSQGGPDGRTAVNFNIEGSSWNETDTSVDGIFVGSARRSGANLDTFPSAESVSEMRINAVGNNAEFAQVADISFITKSGVKKFHGSGFYNYNGSFLNANPFVTYNQPNTSTNTRSVNNNLGGSLGGPVFRDRTFFFADYESLHIHQYAAQSAQVFPDAFRSGDFSSLLSGPNPIQLVDPFNGRPYANDIITEPANPVSGVLLSKYFPAPNAGVRNYQFASPAVTTSNQFDTRLDHQLSQRQRLFGRWSYKKLVSSTPVAFPALGDNNVVGNSYGLVASHNVAFSPTLMNEVRFGWTQSNQAVKPISLDHTRALQDLNLNLIATSFPSGVGFPHILIDGFDGISYQREEDLKERNLQFADNVTWVRARHGLKFGFSSLLLKVNEQSSFNGADGLGEFYFRNFIPTKQNASLDGGTGYSVANFYLGLPSAINQDSAGPDWEGVAHQFGLFAQDSWKITPRLTINYGLRWEIHPPFHENHGNITNFDRATGDAVVPDQASLALAAPTFVQSLNGAKLVTAAQAGIPTSLRYTDRKDLGPRFSIAWLPFANSEHTVLRGGYGLYTIRMLGATFNSLTGIHTASALSFYPTTDAITHTPSIIWPNTQDGSGDIGASPLQSFYTANNVHLRDPYTQQWSVTLEHQIGNATSLRATYTGQHASNLILNPNLNQIPFNTTGEGASGAPVNRPYKNWDFLSSRDNGGTNGYNDLTIAVKVDTHALLLNSTYVLASAISNAEGSTGDADFTSEIGRRPSDRFHLDLDRGHQQGIPTNRWITSLTYTDPLISREISLKGQRALHFVASDWQAFLIATYQSGNHLTANTVWNTSGIESPEPNRPDRVAGKDPNAGPHKLEEWFDRSAFSTDAFHNGPDTNYLGRIGNTPVGSFTGPNLFDLDLSLRRNFPLREGLQLALLGQSKNVLNHPAYANPSTNFEDSNFGKVLGVRSASTRTLIVGARVEF